MPASLELLPRQQFILGLTDGSQIAGQFGTYATSLFGKKKNLTLIEIKKNFLIEIKNEDGSTKVDDNGNIHYDVRLHDMIDFIMCACESSARQKGERFSFNDIQLCQWVDDYAAESGEQNVLITLYGHSIVKAKEGEKKNTDQPAEN